MLANDYTRSAEPGWARGRRWRGGAGRGAPLAVVAFAGHELHMQRVVLSEQPRVILAHGRGVRRDGGQLIPALLRVLVH